MSQIVAGIDLGSGLTKGVLMNEHGEILARSLRRTKANFAKVAEDTLADLFSASGRSRDDVVYTVTTGLGRYAVPFRDLQVTEVTCDGRGSHFYFPEARFVMDIGAQGTRAIHLHPDGKVKEFFVNEKCAAGSGSFIERACRYLEVPLEEVGTLSLRATHPQPISSICAVLAETEIINHISEGQSVENILKGVHISLAERAFAQLRRVGYIDPPAGVAGPEVVLIGGVALQEGLVRVFQDHLHLKIRVPPNPQWATAVGAALLGHRRLAKLAQASAT
ncbi:MAG: acyl-CoA dehydratase activase [bacterium JZ-2024 1]